MTFCAEQEPPRCPFVYDATLAGNCLSEEQQRTIEDAADAGKLPQHARFKSLRAAIGAVFQILHNKDLAVEPNIKRLAIMCRRTAPNTAKYDDTWPVQLIFTFLAVLFAGGTTWESMALSVLRRWTVMLIRLKTAARSADCAAILRSFMPSAMAGLMGSATRTEIRGVRFFRNKTIRFKSRIFSKWFLLGDYIEGDPSDICNIGYCVRTAVETYYARTAGLPRSDDNFFISLTRTNGKYKGVGSDVLRNDSLKCLREAGVPDRFLGHSVRSASLMAQQGSEEEILKRCDISCKVFRAHYDNPVSVDDATAARLLKNKTTLAALRAKLSSVKFLRGGRNAAVDAACRLSVDDDDPQQVD